MSSTGKTPTFNTPEGIEDMHFAIVLTRWHEDIIEQLYEGAKNLLLKAGAKSENIFRYLVPGSYELPLGAQYVMARIDIDAIICLGCVIQGETRHFEFISQAITQSLLNVSLEHDKPIGFGVLTTDTLGQAQERAGGVHGNKGEEAAAAVLDMLTLNDQVNQDNDDAEDMTFLFDDDDEDDLDS
ncbi:MAG: 6,7-dimethyl-8-ribityllumazine synthase [Bernardetiaceae bacterium]|nr:6,7-dimethyl-8-ribityllumazine synthase [Bernardetiaceae bacterium]